MSYITVPEPENYFCRGNFGAYDWSTLDRLDCSTTQKPYVNIPLSSLYYCNSLISDFLKNSIFCVCWSFKLQNFLLHQLRCRSRLKVKLVKLFCHKFNIKSFSSVRKELQNWASYKYDVLSFNDINVVVRLTIISIYSAKIFTISYSYFTKRLAWNKTTKKVEYFSCQWNQFWMPVWRILWPCNHFLWSCFIPIFCRIKNE